MEDNPVVSFVGDLIDKSFYLQDNTLVARLAIHHHHADQRLPRSCLPAAVSRLRTCWRAGDRRRTNQSRKFELPRRWKPAGRTTGRQLHRDVVHVTGLHLHVSCAPLRETGLSASGLVIDPAGFMGQSASAPQDVRPAATRRPR